MGEVLPFRRPRQKGMRSHAREAMTDAVSKVNDHTAIVVIALGYSGDFSIQTVDDGRLHRMDILGRINAIVSDERSGLVRSK